MKEEYKVYYRREDGEIVELPEGETGETLSIQFPWWKRLLTSILTWKI